MFLVGADGSVGHGDGMKDVRVTIGTEDLMLSIPALWNVAINDFCGRLPAELHLLRQSSEGKSAGGTWLFVQDRKEQPDLEELGQALIRDYFVQQLPNATPPCHAGERRGDGIHESRGRGAQLPLLRYKHIGRRYG